MSQFCPSIAMGGALIASGLIHLGLLWFTGGTWEGPLSLRKPGLFGISAGMTIWSISWVLTQLKPRPYDQQFASLMAGGLFAEVSLISVQTWRGVPSHFNRTTVLNATIESTMFGLILLVALGIGWLCWRSRQLPPMCESRAIALRAGLWLLLISCGLGFMAMIVGEMNLAVGHSTEIWGRAGVLKYPHGAALHAIQTLPLLGFFLRKYKVSSTDWYLRTAVASQVLFLIHALWQTLSGRERWNVDLVGGASLGGAMLLLFIPITAIVLRAVIVK